MNALKVFAQRVYAQRHDSVSGKQGRFNPMSIPWTNIHRDGRLKHMPGFANVGNFPSPSDDLPRLKLSEWFGFNLHPSMMQSTLKQ